MTDTDQDINTLVTSYKTLVDAQVAIFFAADLTIGFAVVPWQMAVFSRTLALAAPPPFTDLRALTAGVVGHRTNGFVTSQVSRKQSLTQPT